MAGPTIRVLGNDRIAVREGYRAANGVGLLIDSDETIPVSIDWSGWLGSDTISSVANSGTGATISGASNTTTTATFKAQSSGAGIIEHRITTAAGAVKELPIFINGTDGFIGGRSYYD